MTNFQSRREAGANGRLPTYLLTIETSNQYLQKESVETVSEVSPRPTPRSSEVLMKKGQPIYMLLERFKKCCGRLERGFLGSGEALAKEHGRSAL